jgi:hypothetical protein
LPGETNKSKPAQKAAPKTEKKPAPKTEKPAQKAESKPAPKTEAKPAQKPVQKPAPKTVNKVVTKPVVKPVSKVSAASSSYGGDKQGAKKNKPVRTKESTKKQPMLNTHKLAPFKYDMNEILTASRMDPAKASSFLASVIAKASRISTKAAKEFAKTFLDAEDLTKDEYDKICKLLDRYSKFR